jgi:CheY-like chemotaxis protein
MTVKEAAVLFVEDEPFLRESMFVWLGQKARRVFCADNGEQALEILAANKIDLLISDVRMPVMDGVALVRKIQEPEGRRPAVILVTGFSDLSLREAYAMGVDAIVEKPIDRDELFSAMQQTLVSPEELWRSESAADTRMQLNLSFPSLAAALQEKKIAFGRRGFCIKPPGALQEGPVSFTVEFEADQRILSGEGVVRWTAAREGQAGIEITRVDDASRPWILDLVKHRGAIARIPGPTAGCPGI